MYTLYKLQNISLRKANNTSIFIYIYIYPHVFVPLAIATMPNLEILATLIGIKGQAPFFIFVDVKSHFHRFLFILLITQSH